MAKLAILQIRIQQYFIHGLISLLEKTEFCACGKYFGIMGRVQLAASSTEATLGWYPCLHSVVRSLPSKAHPLLEMHSSGSNCHPAKCQSKALRSSTKSPSLWLYMTLCTFVWGSNHTITHAHKTSYKTPVGPFTSRQPHSEMWNTSRSSSMKMRNCPHLICMVGSNFNLLRRVSCCCSARLQYILYILYLLAHVHYHMDLLGRTGRNCHDICTDWTCWIQRHKQDEPDSLPSRLKLSRQKTTSKLEIQAHLLYRRIPYHFLMQPAISIGHPTVSSLYLSICKYIPLIFLSLKLNAVIQTLSAFKP